MLGSGASQSSFLCESLNVFVKTNTVEVMVVRFPPSVELLGETKLLCEVLGQPVWAVAVRLLLLAHVPKSLVLFI
jgi:hypothetical protein